MNKINLPVWRYFKSYDSCSFTLSILVIFYGEYQMVVEKLLLLFALPKISSAVKGHNSKKSNFTSN